MATFTIVTQANGSTWVVRMTGWAGVDSQPALEREMNRLGASRPKLVILDLSALEGMCSLAVGQLVALQRTLNHRGGTMKIGGSSSDVRTMLQRCKLDELIPMYPSLQEAAAS